MAARYPRCTVLMWLHGVVRRRYVAAMVCREEESGRVMMNLSYPPKKNQRVDKNGIKINIFKQLDIPYN